MLANPLIDARTSHIYRQATQSHHARVHRLFVILMLVQWAFAVALGVVVTPYTWIGVHAQVSQHLLVAFLFGGLLCTGSVVAIRLRPFAASTRHFVAASQILFSTLLIHLSGGRIESHFHIFGSLAFLAFYRDWPILLTATLIVSIDHLARGLLWPLSVFGTPTPGPWRWFEHSMWVLFEDTVLITMCIIANRESRLMASDRAALESASAHTEVEVHERTRELQEITHALRASEENLRKARDEAEAASRTKSEFLANMSHEIRTPMSAIIGYADLLCDPEHPPADKAHCATVIRRNGDQLLTLINDILDLTKIEAGRLDLEKIDCSIPALVHDVCSFMQVRAAGKGVDLAVCVDAEMPPVRTDPVRIRQILTNIVGNAIKFTEHGHVTVSAQCSPQADQVAVTFEVTDTGIGMSQDVLERLCLPFEQADASITRRYGGSGLGLMITKRLAAALGGTLEITSELGRGTRVRVNLVLPRGPASVPSHAAAAPSAPPITALYSTRVLLAEDGLDNQRLLSFYLTKAGANVTVVENGQIACDTVLAATGDQHFDIILMDMQMPELDGYAATRKLRDSGWKGPIVALTAHAMTGDRERCLACGCDEYLSKPVDRAALLRTCATLTRPHTAVAG